MIKRIKQLAVEAGMIVGEPNGFDMTRLMPKEVKFAELIVRECLAQVDKVDAMLDDDKEKTGVAWVGLAIARRFGVEE